jgi:hypothetical protein
MAKQHFSVTIHGKRKGGGSATFDVEVEANSSVIRTSDTKGNNDILKALVMVQRPDVMTSHGTMEEITVMGYRMKE